MNGDGRINTMVNRKERWRCSTKWNLEWTKAVDNDGLTSFQKVHSGLEWRSRAEREAQIQSCHNQSTASLITGKRLDDIGTILIQLLLSIIYPLPQSRVFITRLWFEALQSSRQYWGLQRADQIKTSWSMLQNPVQDRSFCVKLICARKRWISAYLFSGA